jgi:hypothetical protein
MTTSKFTIENEPCFYINNVIIYRVIIFLWRTPYATSGRCCNSLAVAPLCRSYFRPTIFYPRFRISPKTGDFDSHPSRWQVCGVSCVSVCIYPRLVWIFISFAAEIVMCLIKGMLSHIPLGMWRHILYGSWRALLPFYITNNAEFRNTSDLKIFGWGLLTCVSEMTGNDKQYWSYKIRSLYIPTRQSPWHSFVS